jgi:hypothetical protein
MSKKRQPPDARHADRKLTRAQKERAAAEALADDKPPAGPVLPDDRKPRRTQLARDAKAIAPADVPTIRRAIRQRWPVTDAMRLAVADKLVKIVKGRKVEDKDAIAASKALIAADALNVREELAGEERSVREYREYHINTGTVNNQNNQGSTTIEAGAAPIVVAPATSPATPALRIEYDGNWYGNGDKVAAAVASPASGPGQP